MSYKDKLDKCLVSLDVGEKNALLIILTKDGTICRRGNGNPDKEMPMFKGHSDLQHYQAFMMTVHEEHFQFSGVFEQAPIIGLPCKMMIVFSGPGNEEAGFKCNYGHDSNGPPRELAEILVNAVKITDPWYQEQIASAAASAGSHDPTISPIGHTPPAPKAAAWWEFWK